MSKYIAVVYATFDNKDDAEHVHNQALAVSTNASVARIGEQNERTSHGYVAEEGEDGEHIIKKAWHVDAFGIVREDSEPDTSDAPEWIEPTGAHDAYPANNVRGDITRVTRAGRIWRNSYGDGNTWEPGVYGWEPEDDDAE